jgi:hypothetical protein
MALAVNACGQLNDDPEAHVDVRFGTLRDYFQLLQARSQGSKYALTRGGGPNDWC